jgi:Type VI secretion system/phage-baseplate injector OB domain
MNGTRYWGKFRGTVVNNLDLEQRGRIQAIVPAVTGLTPSSWAMPCIPFAGKKSGFFAVPQIGAAIWMEYEDGDPDKPIWVGGFWGLSAEVPAQALAPPPIPPGQNVVLQTTLQNAIVVSDSAPTPQSGGILLKSTTGASILVNDSGIYISNGKGAEIMMVGKTITVNQGALVIT